MSAVELQHSYVKIGENRGSKRIWLENLRLAGAGFTQGEAYIIEFDKAAGAFTIKLDPQGERVVSGRTKKANGKTIPIIELRGDAVKALGKNAERVRVDFHYGELTIHVHHLDRKKDAREQAFISNAMKGTITKGSLCSGIGVATAALADGFADAGIKSSTSWIIDREAKYLQVAIDNNYAVHKDTLVILGSLEEVEPELLPQTDLVQFSLGCTPHSKSGKAKNHIEIAEQHASDATSVFGLMRIIEKVNPAILVSENVVEAKNSASYALIRSMLEIMGYRVNETIIDEEQAGSVEARRRYWFVAVSKGLPELDLNALDVFERQYATLADLVEPEEVTKALWRKHDYLDIKQERDRRCAYRSLIHSGAMRALITTSMKNKQNRYQGDFALESSMELVGVDVSLPNGSPFVLKIVKLVLLYNEQHGGYPSIEWIAEQAGYTTRTIQRKLATESQTSYTDLSTQLKKHLIDKHLVRHVPEQKAPAMYEVATLCGFSCRTSLSHFIKKHWGLTSRQLRYVARQSAKAIKK